MGLGPLVVLVVEVGSVCGPLGWVELDGFCFWDIGALIGWWTLLSRIRDLVSSTELSSLGVTIMPETDKNYTTVYHLMLVPDVFADKTICTLESDPLLQHFSFHS